MESLHFTKNVKFQSEAGYQDKCFAVFKWRLRLLAKITVTHCRTSKMANRRCHNEYKSRVIRRMDILYVLEYAKTNCRLEDYVTVRLPTLIGLRTTEICTLRIEWIDFDTCHFQVLDCKKKQLYPLPLDTETVDLIAQLVAPRIRGYVFTHSNTWSNVKADKPLTRQGVWRRIKKVATIAGVPDLKPRDLRDWFAAYYVYGLDPRFERQLDMVTIGTLQHVLRHENPEMTWRYVNSMVFSEDIDAEYRRRMENLPRLKKELKI